jgi:hypothetical protein
MAAERGTLGALAPAVDHFCKVTASYCPGLFHCYGVPDLPRTNNDLEHFFGAARYRERRATGRKMAPPGTVVRGAVRLVTAVAADGGTLTADQLRPADPSAWRALRRQLDHRHAARRARLRFRRARRPTRRAESAAVGRAAGAYPSASGRDMLRAPSTSGALGVILWGIGETC